MLTLVPTIAYKIHMPPLDNSCSFCFLQHFMSQHVLILYFYPHGPYFFRIIWEVSIVISHLHLLDKNVLFLKGMRKISCALFYKEGYRWHFRSKRKCNSSCKYFMVVCISAPNINIIFISNLHHVFIIKAEIIFKIYAALVESANKIWCFSKIQKWRQKSEAFSQFEKWMWKWRRRNSENSVLWRHFLKLGAMGSLSS